MNDLENTAARVNELAVEYNAATAEFMEVYGEEIGSLRAELAAAPSAPGEIVKEFNRTAFQKMLLLSQETLDEFHAADDYIVDLEIQVAELKQELDAALEALAKGEN